MNILILGGGGREHALVWAVKQNPKCDRLIVAPGNAGIAGLAECAALDIENSAAVVGFATANAIDFVIIGPEAPLVAGVSDDLRTAGFLVFGPSQAAAALEGSKNFTKQICDAVNAPTAAYGHFTQAKAAKDYIRAQGAPIVVKADGLAAGKGVIVAFDEATALNAVDEMFDGTFGSAGAEVVIEEFLDGQEASFFILCDGTDLLPIGTAQDHKRVGTGDTGPNTGGMGAYSPAPVLTDAVAQKALDEIIAPTMAEMARRGMPYHGVLYAGLMIKDGRPKLVEYNARFGDPECQVLMMAANGYPGVYEKGTVIKGLDALPEDSMHMCFHAGTTMGKDGIEANGGRVLNVTARGDSLQQAHDRAYALIDQIDWPDGFYRPDIGWKALQ